MLETARVSLTDWLGQRLLTLSPLDVVCVLLALLVIALSKRSGMWFYAIAALPGTFAHELAHFVVALLLGAHPAFPSLVPVRCERGWRLGSVSFRTGKMRAMPIALAPFALLPLAIWWAGEFLHASPMPWYVLHAWIVAALLSAGTPSRTDWKLAWPALAILAGIFMLAVIAWRLWPGSQR